MSETVEPWVSLPQRGFIKGRSMLQNIIGVDEEVNVADGPEEEYLAIGVALDSGAGDHVADRADAPGYSVEESPGSKRGQQF